MGTTSVLSPERFGTTLNQFEKLAAARTDELAWALRQFQSDLTKELIDSDLETATWLLARTDQFTHALRERVGDGPDRLWDALADLTDSARTYVRRLERDRSEARREQHAATLKERIIDALRTSSRGRPGPLAQELDVSLPQISRALRQLKQDGLVEETDETDADARAVWYALTRAEAHRA